MKHTINIVDYCGNFAENKDIARDLREANLKKMIKNPAAKIVIDFSGIDSSTQSFIHALLSDLFQECGETLLNQIEFKNCSKAVKSLITTVINYSLE